MTKSEAEKLQIILEKIVKNPQETYVGHDAEYHFQLRLHKDEYEYLFDQMNEYGLVWYEKTNLTRVIKYDYRAQKFYDEGGFLRLYEDKSREAGKAIVNKNKEEHKDRLAILQSKVVVIGTILGLIINVVLAAYNIFFKCT